MKYTTLVLTATGWMLFNSNKSAQETKKDLINWILVSAKLSSRVLDNEEVVNLEDSIDDAIANQYPDGFCSYGHTFAIFQEGN